MSEVNEKLRSKPYAFNHICDLKLSASISDESVCFCNSALHLLPFSMKLSPSGKFLDYDTYDTPTTNLYEMSNQGLKVSRSKDSI